MSDQSRHSSDRIREHREKMRRQFERAAACAAAVASPPTLTPISRGTLWLRRLWHFRAKYLRHAMAKLGLLPRGPVRAATFWGRELSLPLLDNDSQFLYWMGILPAPEEVRLTRFLLRTLQPHDVFYDVGASYGFYAWLARELASDGEAHAFEPAPEIFSFLQANAGSDSRLFLNKLALSNGTERTGFFQKTSRHSGGSTLMEEVARDHPNEFRRIEVATTTLDRYVESHSAPTILKLDVEGAESRIIAGGRSVLARAKPLILLEIWPGELGIKFSQPAFDSLRNLGYASSRILEDGTTVPLPQPFPCPHGDNIVLSAAASSRGRASDSDPICHGA